ncbi:MAG TPA: ABC transporter permease [Candidatus Didemnitutus sp.]|jgi:predicted permease
MFSDLRFAFRQFAKTPGFTAVVILTLALGIGANTAIFSVVDAVLLEPLPYRHADRLYQICEMPNPGSKYTIASGGAFIDWQDESTQFDAIAAAHGVAENLTGNGEPVRLSGYEVSAAYFRVFGIAPVLGRDFQPQEDSQGGNHDVVILSNELWQSKFGGDPAIVGKQIHFDRRSLEVIGILPPHALFAGNASFFTPSAIRGSEHHMNRDYAYVVSVIGRLKAGASPEKAAEELTRLKEGVRSQYPAFKQKWTVGLLSLHDEIFGDMRPYVLTLLAAVGVVLLIACANVANLLLARASARQGELAVRAALGATSGRIIRQLLTESVLLAFAGGVAGLALGVLAINPLVIFTGVGETIGADIGINLRVLFFTLAASVVTGLVFGIFPALSAARQRPNEALKEGVRGSTSGGRHRVQSLLLVSETALTVVLLVCAGLLLRSFVSALDANPGFSPDNVLVFDLSISNSKAPSTADKVRLNQRILERLGQVPGIVNVGIASSVPMNGGNGLGDLVSREDRPETRNDNNAGFDSVGGDFFQALKIPLLSGRFLTRQDDTESAPKVMLVNDVLARTLFGKEDPVGRQLHFKEATWEIVGVVGSVRRYQLDYGPTPQVYFGRTYFPWRATVVVRTAVPPTTLVTSIRKAVQEVDADLPLADVGTLEQSVSSTLHVRRVMLVLLGIFAATALLLACVGIYGVISYSVSQRTREMGIRMALGAATRQVLSLVMGQGIKLVLIGIIIGLVGSFGTGFLIAAQLYATPRFDTLVFASVPLVLLSVAFLATWLPARRASRVNPAIALRAE